MFYPRIYLSNPHGRLSPIRQEAGKKLGNSSSLPSLFLFKLSNEGGERGKTALKTEGREKLIGWISSQCILMQRSIDDLLEKEEKAPFK